MRRTALGLVLCFSLTSGGWSLGQAERAPVLPELPRMNSSALPGAARAAIQEAFDTAAAHPRDAAANGKLGNVLYAFGFLAEAEACYQRARLLDPVAFRWNYYLALAQADRGNWEGAAATLRESLRINPEYLPAQLKLGGYLLALGKWQEASELFEAVVKKHPASAEAYYGLGQAQAVRKDLDSAVESLRKASELFPQYGAAHYALAQTYKRLGKMDQAVEQLGLFEKTPASAPEAEDQLMDEIKALAVNASDDVRRGMELAEQGKLEEAVAALEKALQANPKLVEARVNLVSLYGQLGQSTRAEEHFQAAVRLDPKSSANHYNHGLLLASQGRFSDAEGEFRKTL